MWAKEDRQHCLDDMLSVVDRLTTDAEPLTNEEKAIARVAVCLTITALSFLPVPISSALFEETLRRVNAASKSDERRVMTFDARDARVLARRGFKPWALASWHDPNGPSTVVELVSFPYPDGSRLAIKARLVPGDPTTLATIDCSEVFP